MTNIEIEKVERESCHGCGNRKLTLNMILLPYATKPTYICDACKKELIEILNKSS